jgi:DNA-binding NarL/FixJ family response regulator
MNASAILILNADRLYAEFLRQSIHTVFPTARIWTAHSVPMADRVLATRPVEILITGVGASLGGDALELFATPSRPHILVVTGHREYRVLTALRTLRVEGVYDTAEDVPAAFRTALQEVAEGRRYWSPSLLNLMASADSAVSAILRKLTAFEQVVLSVIGDGCDDDAAARRLELCRSTITTVRRQIHRKLGIQHRGQLVRLAAQNGFVRFTPAGVIRPAFSLLCAAYEQRRTKRPMFELHDPTTA